MTKVTEADVDKFFRILGVKANGQGERPKNLYQVLGCLPEVDENGNRLKTPYEFLGVPPQFRDGKEVPIVYAIKNRATKIGKYSGEITSFLYSNINKVRKQEKQNDTLKELISQYKHAEFMGNIDEALGIIEIINSLSGGKADEIMGDYYNYAKFYKKMKKQLLMDMFAHFFLEYIQKYQTQFREGLIKSDVAYKPYFEKKTTFETEEIKDVAKSENFNENGIGQIQQITIDVPAFDDFAYETAPSPQTEQTKTEVKTEAVVQAPKTTVAAEVQTVNQEENEEEMEEEHLLRDALIEENIIDADGNLIEKSEEKEKKVKLAPEQENSMDIGSL